MKKVVTENYGEDDAEDETDLQDIISGIEGFDLMGKARLLIPQDRDRKGNLRIHEDISTISEKK